MRGSWRWGLAPSPQPSTYGPICSRLSVRGVMAALVDHVLGCVMYPLMQRGAWAATTEFKINYLAAVRRGTLTADARVLALTKRTGVVRIDVSNDGRLACIAQGTVLVVEQPAGAPRSAGR